MFRKARASVTEAEAMRETARLTALEQADLNILGLEGLLQTAYQAQQLKKDLCTLLAQQVNFDAVDLVIAEEASKQRSLPKKLAEFPSEDNLPDPKDNRDRLRQTRTLFFSRREDIKPLENKDYYDFSGGLRPGNIKTRRFRG